MLQWWQVFKRDYPWRHGINPYRIMIAEFMLQRTRADQVEDVYRNFIARYPDVISLSKAGIRDVSKYTKNLGIHWRAKNFIHSSRFIINYYGGKIPSNRERLLAIPGVGEYVAGAVLTAGFQKPEWVVDSNIARFLDRFFGFQLEGELRRKPIIVKSSKSFFRYHDPRKLLFGVLDFAALICTPRQPRCPFCPLKLKCSYKRKTKSSKRV